MKDAEIGLQNQLKFATESAAQMRPSMLYQMDTVSTSKKKTAP